jgi:hypothetical protein
LQIDQSLQCIDLALYKVSCCYYSWIQVKVCCAAQHADWLSPLSNWNLEALLLAYASQIAIIFTGCHVEYMKTPCILNCCWFLHA